MGEDDRQDDATAKAIARSDTLLIGCPMADWHYDNGGQPAGPIGDTEVQALLAQGRIHSGTLMWTEGMPGWKPAHELGLFAAASPAGAITTCAECSRPIAPEETVTLGPVTVCPNCRDLVLQRLMAGGSLEKTTAGRKGKRLVFVPGTDLGDACLKCGAATHGNRFVRKLRWHHPAYYLLIFFPGLLIYAIVALLVQKTATVHAPLCAVHRSKRRMLMAAAWGTFLVSAASFAGLSIGDRPAAAFGVSALIGLLTWLVLAVIVSNYPVRAAFISDKKVEVTGPSPAYLDSLPDWTEN